MLKTNDKVERGLGFLSVFLMALSAEQFIFSVGNILLSGIVYTKKKKGKSIFVAMLQGHTLT